MPQIRGINIPKENNVNNLIINGDMKISQRFKANSISSIASSTYMVDRFQYVKSGSMVHNAQQVSDGPSDAQAGYNFPNSLNLALTTPDTSIAAGDICLIQQKIEGYNFSALAKNKMFTLSFWIRATAVGTYCVAFQNSGADRSYVAEYTVNATNTWEYKTITVKTPSPAAGTWNYTNGIGLSVIWTIAAGSTYQSTAGSWNTGNFVATANQVNGTNTGATDFRITGVMLNEGAVAAPFRLFGEDFEGEYSACERYFEKSWSDADTTGTNNKFYTGILNAGGGGAHGPVAYNVTKRAAASITYYNEGTINQVFWRRNSSGDTTNTINAARSTQYGFDIDNVTLGTANQISQIGMAWAADAEL